MSEGGSRPALLGRFRATWLSSPLPMVVEHGERDEISICAAPSLWMRARSEAHALRTTTLPDALYAAPDPGVDLAVQVVVGLRVGRPILPDGPLDGPPPRESGIWTDPSNPNTWLPASRWEEHLVSRFGPLEGWQSRAIGIAGTWTHPDVRDAVLLALAGGSELHVARTGNAPPRHVDGQPLDLRVDRR